MKSNKCWPHITRRLVAAIGLGSFLLAGQSGWAYTKSGKTITTDGSFADVKSAVYSAVAGDIVQVPEGNFVWGHANDQIYITAAITLQGAGPNSTFITLPDDSKAYFNSAVVVIQAAATVRGFSMIESTSCPATGFCAQGANGWRITDITYVNGGGAYFVYADTYGLIDHCVIHGSGGAAELVFARGPADSWQTPNSLGTSNAVIIEDCVFSGSGYVCDANSNARMVVRFCTITGTGIKIDGHGKASNSPARGVRQMEAYGNEWTSVGEGGAWDSMEIRGGTGMFFNNTVDDDTYPLRGIIQLTEYGSMAQWPNFGSAFQTPANYPVDDQIGVGQDPKKGGSEPMYLWNNLKGGALQVLNWATVPTAAVQQYAAQTGKADATFTMQDIIKADRDFFCQASSFDGSSGVGVGTKAQMKAVTPTKTNVGFWVTDEGNWNMTVPTNHSGQLYCWNGSAWALKYVPLVYPFGATTNSYVPPPELPPLAKPDTFTMVKNSTGIIPATANDLLRTTNGTLSLVSVNTTNGTAKISSTNILFTPAANFFGTVCIDYTITDGVMITNSSSIITVSVTNTTFYGGANGAKDLTVWYKFAGDFTTDSSGHNNTGTAYGGWSMRSTNGMDGITNQALYLNGSDQTVYTPGVSRSVDCWSASIWMKPSASNGMLFSFAGEFNSFFVDKGLFITNGLLTAAYLKKDVFNYLQATNPVNLNEWTHVAVTCSYGNITLYENGVAVANVDLGGPIGSSIGSQWFVGGKNNKIGAGNFTGALFDARIYNTYTLSAEETAAIYNTTKSQLPPPTGLKIKTTR